MLQAELQLYSPHPPTPQTQLNRRPHERCCTVEAPRRTARLHSRRRRGRRRRRRRGADRGGRADPGRRQGVEGRRRPTGRRDGGGAWREAALHSQPAVFHGETLRTEVPTPTKSTNVGAAADRKRLTTANQPPVTINQPGAPLPAVLAAAGRRLPPRLLAGAPPGRADLAAGRCGGGGLEGGPGARLACPAVSRAVSAALLPSIQVSRHSSELTTDGQTQNPGDAAAGVSGARTPPAPSDG
jgi:hypothetical protein